MTKNDWKWHKMTQKMIENATGNLNILKRSEKKVKRTVNDQKWQKLTKCHHEKKWQKITNDDTKGTTDTF